jgi:enamine deaminase RidA (YjgF/YER057c/UK114 family)
MAIERLNPDGLHTTPGYHHVTIVDARRTAYIAGQCPLDADGNVVGTTPDEAGLATQVDQIAANALIALSAAGAAPDDVIRSVIDVVSDDGAALAAFGSG